MKTEKISGVNILWHYLVWTVIFLCAFLLCPYAILCPLFWVGRGGPGPVRELYS